MPDPEVEFHHRTCTFIVELLAIFLAPILGGAPGDHPLDLATSLFTLDKVRPWVVLGANMDLPGTNPPTLKSEASHEGPRMGRNLKVVARVWTVAVCMVVMATSIGCAYDAGSFEGDGAATDRGFWSYRPRYRIELRPSISLAAPDRHEFRFRGLPSDPLSVFLAIQDEGRQDYERLRRLRTSVGMTLTDGSGTVVCRAAGALSDWTLMWSTGRVGAYWQRPCVDLRLGNNEWYTLNVMLDDVDPASPPLRVTPILSGGGWDSP